MRHSHIIEEEIKDLKDFLNDKENSEGWEEATRKDIRVLEEELAETLDYEDEHLVISRKRIQPPVTFNLYMDYSKALFRKFDEILTKNKIA